MNLKAMSHKERVKARQIRIEFTLLTNAVLVWATNVSSPKNHRFYEKDQQLIPRYKKDSKSKIKKDVKLALHGSKENKFDSNERLKEKEYVNPWNLSKETDRIQFQIEGHKGPQTYMFGFDTGHGKNRQYRLEERLQDGTVKGQYGYYDARGKLRTVQYIARPFEGYVEKHHESNTRKSEN
ncbi:uncharacterized protein LOC128894164 isoform X1 [Hylaeus anthracinus]|uniref:uncharacterized protein LOC128894164 isoform X1 n=1 Tax=Hylaeus anthracinus TaxID=313031 RepID=UPI0023B9C8F3|nr:uncharacterized protein LOC128894164 isoform X1 [Hylaeus anthracinus]XP_054011645.1 uncharacterized protein LOC128894164 isoform X1 [Hylaeus anthracinus]